MAAPLPLPTPPRLYAYCVVCGTPKRTNRNPYCPAHADLWARR